MSLLDELLALEHEGWQSLCDATGGEHYGRAMTDDAVMVLADGSVLDREGVIASLAGAPPWASFEILEPRAIPLGADAAALVYTGVGRRAGAADFVARMASTYVRAGGQWRLALYQQTPRP